MSDQLTISGVVATEPRVFTTSAGVRIVSFRLATSQRYLDRASNEWRDPGSNWYTVSCFRQLADNVANSITKSDRVLVVGRLKIRTWSSDGREGTNVDIEADSIGHDLHWGTSQFVRSVSGAGSDLGDGESSDTAHSDGFVPDTEATSWPTAPVGNVA